MVFALNSGDVDQRSDHDEMPPFDHPMLMMNMKEIGAQTVSAMGKMFIYGD